MTQIVRVGLELGDIFYYKDQRTSIVQIYNDQSLRSKIV
ncbi:hypothetical protein L8106_05700 [Lyngbya sp. PCC 8106]|nr:hypothetical protein L8106_05700 [Lyngbya sp. PCC 8106]